MYSLFSSSSGLLPALPTFSSRKTPCGFTRRFLLSSLVGLRSAISVAKVSRRVFQESGALSMMLFAFSTVISWSYYGTRAINYLLGEKYIKPFRFVYALFVFFGCIWGIDLVWHFVDMVITFMTIPNLIALLLLAPIVMKETRWYFSEMKKLGKLK